MMNRPQYLLGKLAEECNEVAQRALKAQQFGLDEVEPGQSENNEERMTRELHDLFAHVHMLIDMCGMRDPNDHPEYDARMTQKMAKVTKAWEYMVSLGQAMPTIQAVNHAQLAKLPKPGISLCGNPACPCSEGDAPEGAGLGEPGLAEAPESGGAPGVVIEFLEDGIEDALYAALTRIAGSGRIAAIRLS